MLLGTLDHLLQDFKSLKLVLRRRKIDHKALVALDVPTRWNSTYLMLESALKFQKAFDRMEEDDENYLGYFPEDEHRRKKVGPPLFIDWENARVFVKFLEIFYDVTLKFSALFTITSNLCFHELSAIFTELTNWSKSGDRLLGNMATIIVHLQI